MDLQSYQRSLRRLMTGAAPAADDPPYARALVSSTGLAVVREVIEFWRAHGVERFCVLSAGWLKRRGQFDAAIKRFVATTEFSPDIAEAGQQFLQHLSNDDDALVRALAQFELALHETRLDPTQFRRLDWPCDPRPVLAEILEGCAATCEAEPHRVTVSRSLPGGYACEPIPIAAASD